MTKDETLRKVAGAISRYKLDNNGKKPNVVFVPTLFYEKAKKEEGEFKGQPLTHVHGCFVCYAGTGEQIIADYSPEIDKWYKRGE